ncbi:hypothetical protein D3C73_1671400 [compost metagenome]
MDYRGVADVLLHSDDGVLVDANEVADIKRRLVVWPIDGMDHRLNPVAGLHVIAMVL